MCPIGQFKPLNEQCSRPRPWSGKITYTDVSAVGANFNSSRLLSFNGFTSQQFAVARFQKYLRRFQQLTSYHIM